MNTRSANPDPRKSNQQRSDRGLKAAILSMKIAFEHPKLTPEQKADVIIAAVDIIRQHGAISVVDSLMPDPQKIVRQGGGCEHEVAILELGVEIEQKYNKAITRLTNLSTLLQNS